MINNKRVLALVPARGGSKRIPNKNIIEFCGSPLINMTLKCSLNSEYIDEIVVSTDNKKISEVANKFDVEVIQRPNNISGDHSPTIDTILHVLEYKNNGFEIIVLLQPTSPLRTANDIDRALEYHQDKNSQSVISVCETEHNIQHINVLPESKNMKNFINENDVKTRTQDLTKHYRLNGALYIADIPSIKKNKTFFMGENTYAYIMDKINSIDIDDQYDLKVAEFLFKNYMAF